MTRPMRFLPESRDDVLSRENETGRKRKRVKTNYERRRSTTRRPRARVTRDGNVRHPSSEPVKRSHTSVAKRVTTRSRGNFWCHDDGRQSMNGRLSSAAPGPESRGRHMSGSWRRAVENISSRLVCLDERP